MLIWLKVCQLDAEEEEAQVQYLREKESGLYFLNNETSWENYKCLTCLKSPQQIKKCRKVFYKFDDLWKAVTIFADESSEMDKYWSVTAIFTKCSRNCYLICVLSFFICLLACLLHDMYIFFPFCQLLFLIHSTLGNKNTVLKLLLCDQSMKFKICMLLNKLRSNFKKWADIYFGEFLLWLAINSQIKGSQYWLILQYCHIFIDSDLKSMQTKGYRDFIEHFGVNITRTP